MKINEVAAYFHLPPETLRYWEKEGIITKVKRNDSGYREYDRSDIDWIRYVKCIREIGIPIAQIKQYTQLARAGRNIKLRKEILIKQRDQLRAQLEEIQSAVDLVTDKIDHYDTYTR